MVDFSQRLKKVRMDRHLTQAQVARKIGVTASMVSSYETDIRLPSYDVMIRIAQIVRNVEGDQLVADFIKEVAGISLDKIEMARVETDSNLRPVHVRDHPQEIGGKRLRAWNVFDGDPYLLSFDGLTEFRQGCR